MLRALDEYEISGVRTTIPFCEFTLQHESFVNGNYDTHFVQNHYAPVVNTLFKNDSPEVISIVSSLLKNRSNETEANQTSAVAEPSVDGWWKNRTK